MYRWIEIRFNLNVIVALLILERLIENSVENMSLRKILITSPVELVELKGS